MKAPHSEFCRGIARRLLRGSNLLVLTALAAASLVPYPAPHSPSRLVLHTQRTAIANLRAPGQSVPGAPNGGPHNGPYIHVTGNRPNPAAWMRLVKAARQKALYEDADKLLKLATQLNSEMSDPNAGPIADGQLRTAAKIEKLARQVERNMSGR